MAAQPEKKDGYPLTRTTVSTALLIACSCLTLTSCQAPESGTGPAGRETTPTDASGTPSVGAVPDLSSATSNADGGPIVFDPVEAGKNLPDPCTELSATTLNEIGFRENPNKTAIGLNDNLLGKAITCSLDLIETVDNFRALGMDSDNVSKEYMVENGLFIREAPESIGPNAYFYTFSPGEEDICWIGADTARGRLGLSVAGPTPSIRERLCEEAVGYFDKAYVETDGFSWLVN
ncbi:DUF3558 family protein [Corynebacterium pygosceleis]|uniref:DUF3558 family protein n=1 Tax=Corynebacterium pygosceleis TaxID=2800406 RepID=UPI0020066E10|nr:DUF3558 family protein [Corynebacterium pygosceleis]MCK7676229.1 DUF3558 domain-containing protein [Corynebacterium pygosceleis]